jgi:hypothetical protein
VVVGEGKGSEEAENKIDAGEAQRRSGIDVAAAR